MKIRVLTWTILVLFTWCFPAIAKSQAATEERVSVDICVYGGTAAGVIAAYTAQRSGKKVILIEPGELIGGMSTGGLGWTDFGNKGSITGLSRQFYQRVALKYGFIGEQWIFEPRVAQEVINDYLTEENITVYSKTRLVGVRKTGGAISGITVRKAKADKWELLAVSAKVFIDCTYEGDLMAKSGVTFTTGREDNKQYGETLNGFQLAEYHQQSGYHQFPDSVSPYKIPGNPASGLLWGISNNRIRPAGTGDKQIQAYNFRVCLTDKPENMIPITRPEGYDPARYELLIRLFDAQPEMRSINHYFIWSILPNRKTDINNRGGFSTDMIGENYDWIEADYEKREELLRKATAYTKGLLYFVMSDERVPDTIRNFVKRWGYPRDEYNQFGHFTPQLYIREGRRMVSDYVITEHNCMGEVTVDDGVGLASYTMDSHNTERLVVDGMVKNEGNVEVRVPAPYPIPYRSIVPQAEECSNLLVPVCLSASHIAFGSIRMEPVFMVLGQSAGLAAVQAIDDNVAVQDIDVPKLQRKLAADPYLSRVE